MGQREPGIIPAAEWGEKPRETVTVKPAEGGISQIRRRCTPGFANHRSRIAACRSRGRRAARFFLRLYSRVFCMQNTIVPSARGGSLYFGYAHTLK